MRDLLIRTSAVMLALFCVAAFTGVALAINPVCGDGITDPNANETCDPPGIPSGPNGNDCRADCTFCGDGILDEGEGCDDGDSDNFDECANDCTVGPECGDGLVDSATGETCDPPSLPAPNGSDCRDDCTFCGDGFMDLGEECDDGDSDDMDECANDCTVPPGNEGCTPGYWKNKTFAWVATAFSPDMLVGDVFTLPGEFSSLGSATLLEALSWSSGDLAIEKAANLIKHAVASLLNASHAGVAFSWAVGDIIDAVNDALVGGDPDYMDDLHVVFDDANNAGCPLSGRPPRARSDVSERDQALRRGVSERINSREDNRPVDLQMN
jgi:hypothetical protein